MHTSGSENRINAPICTVSHDTCDRIMVCYLIKESSFAYSFMVNPVYLSFAYIFFLPLAFLKFNFEYIANCLSLSQF